MNIADIAIRRPVFTTMVMLALMILGLVSLGRLGVDLFPDVNFPIASIVTIYPGAGPEEVEALVTRPLEDAVSSINGLDRVTSTSREGASVVVIQFKLDIDIKLAAVDVREKVAKVRGILPRDIEDPVISRVDPGAMPIMFYTVSGDRSPQKIREATEEIIKKGLESVDGVAAVNVIGGQKREIQVNLSAAKLQALNLTPLTVAQFLSSENVDVPAGRFTINAEETVIRSRGQFRSVSEIGEVVLPVMNGAPVKLKEVADIVDGTAESRVRTSVNSVPAVTFEIVKGSGTNTLAVGNRVETALTRLESRLSSGLKVTKIYDSRNYIRENTHEVNISILFGGAMAIMIIYLFMMDWRSTLISALALPTSVVTTFFVMDQLGFTLNMMSLLAISLAIGLLIDDAVVVRENIFRHLEMGKAPMVAASEGTREIALAVMATTFTIVAVFVPVAFTGGMIGQFFRQFGLTIAAAVLVSLFVAFTLDPMLSARLVKPIDHDAKIKDQAHPIKGPILRTFQALDQFYRESLVWSMKHRKTVMALATVLFLGSLYLVKFMGTEFFPKPDRAEFMVYLEMPAGTSIDAMDEITREAESLIAQNPYIVTRYTTVGVNNDPTRASLRIKAVDKNDRPMTLIQIIEDLRAKLVVVPDLKVTMADVGFIEGAIETPIMLNIRGDDYDTLKDLAHRAREIVRNTPGTADVDWNYRPGKPEIQVAIDRDKAGDLGVSVAQLGLGLRAAIEGDISSKFREGEHEYDIRVRLRPEDRDQKGLLETYTFPSRTGRMVTLGEVASVHPASGPAVIERENRQRQITITGNLVNRSLGEVVSDIEAELAKLERPDGYAMAFTGEAERMKDSMQAMGIALVLAIIFVYLVLASQFESFIHPFTIMFSLPLAIVGALLSLFLTGFPLGMSTFIGIILLMGLVTKNAILLVDYTNQLREERGMSIEDALLEAGPTRLRPILMTSTAMVLGMMPTAVSTGSGSEFRAPMAIAVIGGVMVSTILTLVVVPVVYTWMDGLTLKGRAERRKRKGAHRLQNTADAEKVPPSEDVTLPPAWNPAPAHRSTSTLAILIVAGLLALCLPALAQDSAPTSPDAAASSGNPAKDPISGRNIRVISLQDAYRLALDSSPDLKILGSRLDQTQLIMTRVIAALQPMVQAVGMYSHASEEATLSLGPLITSYTDYQLYANGLTVVPVQDEEFREFLETDIVIQPEDTYRFQASATWGIFNARTIPLLNVARASIKAAEAGTEWQRREFLFAVAQTYYALYALDQASQVAQEFLASKERNLELTRYRFAAGQIAQNEVLRAEVEVVKARTQLRESQQSLHMLAADFAVLLGQPTTELRALRPDALEPPTATLDTDAVLQHRSDLVALKAQLRAMDASILDAKMEFLPSIALQASYSYSNATGFSGENDSWTAGATASLPIWDGGLRLANVKEAKFRAYQTREQLRKQELQAQKEIEIAQTNITQARINLEAAEQEEKLARSTSDQMTALYDAGRATSLELRDTELLVASAALNRVRQALAYDLTVLALQRATGTFVSNK